MKNKLIISNFNSCQIFVNILFLLGGIYYLDGVNLYSMVIVSLLGLSLNVYVLWWSYKNKIYDADLLLRCTPTQSFVGFFGMSLLTSIRPFFNYCVLASVVTVLIYLNSLTSTDYDLHPWFYGFMWVVSIVSSMLTFFGCGLYIISILSATDNMFPIEKEKFIQQFKLNMNETIFCSSGREITGFLSAGLLYVKDHGLIYDNVTYTPDDVISYLNAANINLSELDSNHVKVMSMYCYA